MLNHLVIKPDQLVDIAMSNIFMKYFKWLGGQSLKSRPYQAIAIN